MESWNQLLPFVTVMREGSFRKASLKLRITPAAVSQSIATLERHLGVRLFRRTTRQTYATDEARALYESIGALVEDLDQRLHAMDDMQGEPAGVIRLSMAPAFGRQRVLPVLPDFLKRFPKVRLELHFDNPSCLTLPRNVDLVISHGALGNAFVSRLLRQMKLILVAAPKYLERRGGITRIAEANDILPIPTVQR